MATETGTKHTRTEHKHIKTKEYQNKSPRTKSHGKRDRILDLKTLS